MTIHCRPQSSMPIELSYVVSFLVNFFTLTTINLYLKLLMSIAKN